MQVCFFTLMSFLQFSWKVKKGRSFLGDFQHYYWPYCERLNKMAFFNRSAFFCLHDRGNFTKTTKERICLIFNEYFQELSSILDTFDSNGESYYTLRNPYFTTLKLKIPVFNATLTIFHTMLYAYLRRVPAASSWVHI